MKLTEFLENIGRPVAYYPSLVKLTGSVSAVIFLCQLLYWKGRQADPDGWIFKTQAEITEETGLTRYEQETARKILKEKGLLIEKFAGVPRKLYFSLSIDRINELWLEVQNTSLTDVNNPEEVSQEKALKNPHNECETSEEDEKTLKNQHNAGKPHYIMWETNIIECGKPACNNAENQQTITEITTENITKNIYSLSDGENTSPLPTNLKTPHKPRKPTRKEEASETPSLFTYLMEEKSQKRKKKNSGEGLANDDEPNQAGEGSTAKELLLFFAREYEAHFGNPYNINWGKEMKLFSLLLKRYEPEKIKKAVKWYFRMRDDFFFLNGYSVGVFYQKFNAILLTGQNSISEIIDRVAEEQIRRKRQCIQERV